MDERLQAVVESNIALQRRAKELNIRAGEEAFPVMSQSQWKEWLAARLNGARRAGEIINFEALRLPELDQEIVNMILSENPDTIEVLGRSVAVEYRSGYAPRLRMDFRGEESRNWLQLPDEGIHLPSGREVSMYSAVEGYGYYIEAPSSQFKAKARECLNQGLWDNWRKPELPAPTDSIPPITETEYGRCVVTGVSLVAYGTVNYDSYYGSWKSYWSRDRAEADKVHAQACAKFVEVKEKAARDVLKKRVGELYRAHSYNRELAEDMRSRMYNTYYGYSGGATTVAEIEAFIAEVEVAVAAIEEKKVEAERKQHEAEARRGEAELACSEASEGLFECARRLEVYESANNEEAKEASRLMDDLSGDLRSGHYEDVIQKAREAEEWLRSVRTAIKERSRKPPTADALTALRAKFGK